MDHPAEARLRATAFPVGFSATPAEETRRHAPRLGEHTREVLAEIGYTDARRLPLCDNALCVFGLEDRSPPGRPRVRT